MGGQRQRDLVLLHAGVAVLCALVVPFLRIGPAALLAVVAYELALLALALGRRDAVLLRLWWFAVTLSLWQVVPDQILVEVVGSLVFPPDGVPDIGAVTLPLAGMWAVPAVIVVAVADAVEARRGASAAVVAAGLAALVVFAAAEAVVPGLGLWQPVGVRTVGSVAPYILVAEVVLGMALWLAWCVARARPAAVVPLLTALVSLTYTGAAVVSWYWLG